MTHHFVLAHLNNFLQLYSWQLAMIAYDYISINDIASDFSCKNLFDKDIPDRPGYSDTFQGCPVEYS